MTPNFLDLINLYVREDVSVRPQDADSPKVSWDLRIATVAQWMLESGRGSSLLAREHNNFGGLKWLDPNDTRTGPYATRVFERTPSEPQGVHWRKFATLEDWLLGYWQFIETGSYEDPMRNATDPAGYIQMLKDHGYAKDPAYVGNVVQLFPEAEAALYKSAQRQGIDPDDSPDPSPSLATFKLAVVVGHNSVKKGACSPHLDDECEWPWNSEIARLMEKRAANRGIVMQTFFRTFGGNTATEIRRAYRTEVNPWKPDLCMELHYNGGGGDGTEMLYWRGSVVGKALARNLADAVAEASGIATDRQDDGIWGIRSGNGSVSLKTAVAPNCVVEPFFGDTKHNVETILAAGGQSMLADVYLAAARKTAEEHGLVTEGLPVDSPPVPMARAVTTDEFEDLRREARALKEVVTDLTLENRLLKKKHDRG